MDKGFALIERLIHATNARHKVLASNLANVDTPNYRAKDIDFKSYLEGAGSGLAVTDPKHIQPSGTSVPVNTAEANSHVWGDGNNVEIDTQISRMTENALLYEAGVKLLSAKIKMYKTAAGGK